MKFWQSVMIRGIKCSETKVEVGGRRGACETVVKWNLEKEKILFFAYHFLVMILFCTFADLKEFELLCRESITERGNYTVTH